MLAHEAVPDIGYYTIMVDKNKRSVPTIQDSSSVRFRGSGSRVGERFSRIEEKLEHTATRAQFEQLKTRMEEQLKNTATRAQFEQVAEQLKHTATRAQLEQVHARIERVEEKLEHTATRAQLEQVHARIGRVEEKLEHTATHAQLEQMKVDIMQTQTRSLRWFAMTMIVSIGVIVTIVQVVLSQWL